MLESTDTLTGEYDPAIGQLGGFHTRGEARLALELTLKHFAGLGAEEFTELKHSIVNWLRSTQGLDIE